MEFSFLKWLKDLFTKQTKDGDKSDKNQKIYAETSVFSVAKSGFDIFALDDRKSMLNNYALKGDYYALKDCINAANINELDANGNNALFYAIKGKNLKIINLLLDHKININIKNHSDATPLLLAIITNHIEIVKLLLERGAKIDNSDNLSPITCACFTHNLNLVRLLEEFGGSDKSSNSHKETPYLAAACTGAMDIVQHLLNKGNIDINEKTALGWNALMLAVSRNKLEMAKYLISKNIDINAVENTNTSALLIAAGEGHTDIVKYLLDHKANIKNRDKSGLNALHYAITFDGDIETIKLLLNHRIDINAKTNLNWSALMLAASKGDEKIVELLLDNGADTSTTNNDGNTAMDLVNKNNKRLLKLFKNRGLKNENEISDEVFLINAIKNHNTHTIEILLNKGVDINYIDDRGFSALMYAAKDGIIDTIEYLIDNGADVSLANKKGQKAIDIAKEFHQYEAVNYLLNRS